MEISPKENHFFFGLISQRQKEKSNNCEYRNYVLRIRTNTITQLFVETPLLTKITDSYNTPPHPLLNIISSLSQHATILKALLISNHDFLICYSRGYYVYYSGNAGSAYQNNFNANIFNECRFACRNASGFSSQLKN